MTNITAISRAQESLQYGEQRISETQEKISSIWHKIAAFFSFFKDRIGNLAFHVVALFHIRTLLKENMRLRQANIMLVSELTTLKAKYQTLFHRAYAMGQLNSKLVKQMQKLHLEKSELQLKFDTISMDQQEEKSPIRTSPFKDRVSPIDEDSWQDLSNDKRDETSDNLYALIDDLDPNAKQSSSSSSQVMSEEELLKSIQDLDATDL